MNRRGFFAAIAAAVAGASLDPERLLWVPGKKLISIPQPHVSVTASDDWRPCIHHDELNQYVNQAFNDFRKNKRGVSRARL